MNEKELNCGFRCGDKTFRYRAAAIIVEDGCVLFATNELDNYYYSVGGAVHLGETAEDAVRREVQEETGVDQLQLRRLICVTDHCYFRNEKWHLKHTWWYEMLYTKPIDLIPQRDEDITKAVWIPRSCIASYLIDTYPSIIEVFRSSGI